MDKLTYPFQYRRLPTYDVSIGKLKMGGDNPILIQSMLTSPTHDTERCVAEIQELAQSGCELIRLTVPKRKDLDNIPEIRRVIKEEGIDTCLVADIHFAPQLAVDACELFEKVRINPGNFSDSSKNSAKVKKGAAFEEGREILKEALFPLVANLNRFDRALRVGVNQGSLSERMIEKYGDTPLGMVESALETTALLRELGFDQTVISLKSSNPLVVQKAYRLLTERQEGPVYIPTHLGVTEAGNGDMARVKSLVGIGVLLRDGIGDTIRVSLAEPSANEIVFARKLVDTIQMNINHGVIEKETRFWSRSLTHQRVENRSIETNGAIVLGKGSAVKIGYHSGTPLPESEIEFNPDFDYQTDSAGRIFLDGDEIPRIHRIDQFRDAIQIGAPILFQSENPLDLLRSAYEESENAGRSFPPVGMMFPFENIISLNDEIELAGILSEGLVDFLLVDKTITSDQFYRLALLLQATRAKMIMTDYIICPSCGRTLFDIQKTSEAIKNATAHLTGLKIGIMGCIVNGPGEMADADFGYVGSGAGKVDLYCGQTRVKRGIEEKNAVNELLRLIEEKRHNMV